MPLTEEYRKQLRAVHSGRSVERPWGTTGERNAGMVLVEILSGRSDVHTVLDFGSGQGSLGALVNTMLPRLVWSNYDPGIPGIDTLPDQQFDFIVSSDVMEHVEPELVAATITWMRLHARKGMFHHIACDPCGLILPDGRNAHLTCREPSWWRSMFENPEWSLMYYADCIQRKRGTLRRHCQLQLDHTGVPVVTTTKARYTEADAALAA